MTAIFWAIIGCAASIWIIGGIIQQRLDRIISLLGVANELELKKQRPDLFP